MAPPPTPPGVYRYTPSPGSLSKLLTPIFIDPTFHFLKTTPRKYETIYGFPGLTSFTTALSANAGDAECPTYTWGRARGKDGVPKLAPFAAAVGLELGGAWKRTFRPDGQR